MSPDVLQTMDPVELSFGEALLKDAGIAVGRTEPEFGTMVPVVEPSPGRLIVSAIDYERALLILNEGLKPIRERTPS